MQRASRPPADRAAQVFPQISAQSRGRAVEPHGDTLRPLAAASKPVAPEPALRLGRRGDRPFLWSGAGPAPDADRASPCHPLKKNLPVALIVTLYTNPFTIVPLYLLAYAYGELLLPGERASSVAPFEFDWSEFGASMAALGDWMSRSASPRLGTRRPRVHARRHRLRGRADRLAHLRGERLAFARAAPQGMTHAEFVAAYEAGRIRVSVNRDAASRSWPATPCCRSSSSPCSAWAWRSHSLATSSPER